jgi:hypothetical protein
VSVKVVVKFMLNANLKEGRDRKDVGERNPVCLECSLYISAYLPYWPLNIFYYTCSKRHSVSILLSFSQDGVNDQKSLNVVWVEGGGLWGRCQFICS